MKDKRFRKSTNLRYDAIRWRQFQTGYDHSLSAPLKLEDGLTTPSLFLS